MSVLVTEADFEALAYAYFTKARSQNVIHAEVFFDPQAHTVRGVLYETVLAGFKKAQEKANIELELSSELIVCMLRHLPVADCRKTYLEALPDIQSGRIRGLGLSSTEKGYPPSLYADIYSDARRNGVKHLTAHAGEEADASYMAEALEHLRCVRVDHGIKLTEDAVLMKRYADGRILVTMCPLSNLELRCVKRIADMPIRQYLDNHVPFSLNSDDPAYFGGYVLENYCAVQEAFGLSMDDWRQIVKNSSALSWCSDERKRKLDELADAVFSKFA